MSAEHLEGINGPMMKLPNAVIHERQPVTSDIPDISGSCSVEL